MSIETTEPPAAGPHGEDGGHFLEPEVVDRGQRLGVWLFIGGDIIIVSALLFTYLYLRGVNTSGHWMSMLGYQGHSYAYYQNAANLPAPTLIHVKAMSAGFDWLITAVTVVTAGIIWQGERALRVTKNAPSPRSSSPPTTARAWPTRRTTQPSWRSSVRASSTWWSWRSWDWVSRFAPRAG